MVTNSSHLVSQGEDQWCSIRSTESVLEFNLIPLTEDGEAEVVKGMSEEELIDMMHFGQVMTSIVSMRVISNNNSFSSSYGGLLYQVRSKRREP